MREPQQNYYGSLCTEMYELLHKKAPEDELNFYLSYAEQGLKILEPLCGSGRFLVPFMERACLVRCWHSCERKCRTHLSSKLIF